MNSDLINICLHGRPPVQTEKGRTKPEQSNVGKANANRRVADREEEEEIALQRENGQSNDGEDEKRKERKKERRHNKKTARTSKPKQERRAKNEYQTHPEASKYKTRKHRDGRKRKRMSDHNFTQARIILRTNLIPSVCDARRQYQQLRAMQHTRSPARRKERADRRMTMRGQHLFAKHIRRKHQERQHANNEQERRRRRRTKQNAQTGQTDERGRKRFIFVKREMTDHSTQLNQASTRNNQHNTAKRTKTRNKRKRMQTATTKNHG